MKLTGEAKLLLALAVVVGGGAGLMFLMNRPTPPPPPLPPAKQLDKTAVEVMFKASRHTKGDPSAPMTIIEFADFQCPSCRKAYDQHVRTIEKDLNTRFAFLQYPLDTTHEFARPAAVASEAAHKQGKFWEFYHAVFDPKIPDLTMEDIEAAEKKAGLDIVQLKKDEKDPALTKMVFGDRDLGSEYGVDTTPTFIIQDKNGKIVQVSGAKNFDKMFDDLKDGSVDNPVPTNGPPGMPPGGPGPGEQPSSGPVGPPPGPPAGP